MFIIQENENINLEVSFGKQRLINIKNLLIIIYINDIVVLLNVVLLKATNN